MRASGRCVVWTTSAALAFADRLVSLSVFWGGCSLIGRHARVTIFVSLQISPTNWRRLLLSLVLVVVPEELIALILDQIAGDWHKLVRYAATSSHIPLTGVFYGCPEAPSLRCSSCDFRIGFEFLRPSAVCRRSGPCVCGPLSCPEPTTNVSNKVTLDWDNAQLVDHSGREIMAVGD